MQQLDDLLNSGLLEKSERGWVPSIAHSGACPLPNVAQGTVYRLIASCT
jgi:hypothetical protein